MKKSVKNYFARAWTASPDALNSIDTFHEMLRTVFVYGSRKKVMIADRDNIQKARVLLLKHYPQSPGHYHEGGYFLTPYGELVLESLLPIDGEKILFLNS